MRCTLAIAGLLLLGGSRGPLHAQDLSGFIAESQAALRVMAEETGRFAVAGPQETRDLPHGGGIIRGVVTSAATGAPISGATIRAMLSTANASPVTTTADERGAFELRGLTPGRWRVSASRQGFLPREFGQRGRTPQGTTIELKDRAQVTAHIALVRPGAVAGRVFDGFGDPAVGIRVQVMQFTRVENGRRLVPAGVADVTDDTGAFRVYNLAPGDYLLSARALTSHDLGVTRFVGDRTAQFDADSGRLLRYRSDPTPAVPTYFPGTPELERAATITLDAGSDQTGLDFTLSAARPVRVSGFVRDSSGEIVSRPVSVALFSDTPHSGTTAVVASPVNQVGAFAIPEVAPGSYVLTVNLAGPNGRPEAAEVPLLVGVEDVADLSIVTAPGVPLTGVVVSDGAALPSLKGVTFRATSVGERGGVAGTAGAVIDGRFQVPNLFGTFRLQMQGLPAGWSVKAIEVDGIDVTDAPVSFKSGRPHATVVLTNRETDLNGIVTRDGKPFDADVLIFPEDPARWTAWRFVRSVRADERGTFALKGLPPHDGYLAIATTYLDPDDVLNSDFLALARARATSFSLGEGQSQRLRLTLVDRSEIDGR